MKQIPATIRFSLELLGLFLLGYLIVIGKIIVMPLLLSFFISIMLLPLFRFFKRRKFPDAVAILLPILLVITIMALIVWLFSNQVSFLLYDYEKIEENLSGHLNALSAWVSSVFGFSPAEQLQFINQQSTKLFNYAGSLLSGAAGSATNTLLFFGLLPIYTFLIILYRNTFMKFLTMSFESSGRNNIGDTMLQIEKMVKKYLLGLLIQITYVALLIWAILAIIGIKHALLIGIIFAFLNLIPYLGALLGNILGILITLATSSSIADVLFVLGTISLVQLLDNNILMPRVVGSQVKLNALVSIVGIFIAGAMTGISGMFLALPIMAVLKIICDRSEKYKNWGLLLGEEKPAKKPFLRRAGRKGKLTT